MTVARIRGELIRIKRRQQLLIKWVNDRRANVTAGEATVESASVTSVTLNQKGLYIIVNVLGNVYNVGGARQLDAALDKGKR